MQGQQRYPNPALQPPAPPPQQQPHLNDRMSNLSLAPNGVAQNGHMQPPMPQQNYQYQSQAPPPTHQMPPQQQQAVPPPQQQQPRPNQPPYPQQPQPPTFQQPPPASAAPGPPPPRPAMRPAMRPAPSTIPTRPLPNSQPAPQQQPTMYQPPAPGVAPAPAPYGQPPAPPTQQQQQQPQQPQGGQQVSSLGVPRPVYKLCGLPRPYFYRSLINASNEQRAALPPGVVTQIPSSNADFLSLDDGNASLRYARLTTNSIHVDPSTMNKSQVPFAVLLQPFADPQPKEAEIPVVWNMEKGADHRVVRTGTKGPLRCGRCAAYVNPGFRFYNGGQKFTCNICHFENDTPPEHYAPVNHMGQRMDSDDKPELKYGSVDYVVESPDYYINPPQPSKYIFAVDISLSSINSGLSLSSLQSMKSCLMANLIPGCNESAGGKSRVAIITFDKSIHFFDARGCDPNDSSKQVKMNIVSDIEDPFVPIGGDALFLTPQEAICAIDAAIEIHKLNVAPPANGQQQQQQAHQSAESSLGSVLHIIKEALTDIGGKVYLVSGSIPTSGLHKLERRGGGVINSNEDREMSLLKEANSSYDILGCELAEQNISVDLILAPTSIYIDSSTLSKICRNSGGKMFLFTGFDIVRDGASLHRTICKNVSEARAFEALLRVRTSPGIEAKGEYIGNFGRPQRGDDLTGPVFDSTSTIGLEFSVASKLEVSENNNSNYNSGEQNRFFNEICIQAAILYTDCNGLRRIRVHTMFLKKTSVMADMFSSADVDATAAFFAKRVASAVLYGNTPFSKGWDGIMQKMSQMFYMYRKHCTSTQASGQLILPEAYKTLPLLMLGLVKSAALRKNGHPDGVTVDERSSALSFVISASVREIAAFCYPRIYNISDLSKEAGNPLPLLPSATEEQQKQANAEPISLPDAVPCASTSLEDNTILLIDAGTQLVVWIGAVNDEKIQSTAYADIVAQPQQPQQHTLIRAETANAAALLKGVSPNGARIAKIIQRICSERKWLSRPVVVERMKPGTGLEGKWVLPLLVEDRGVGGMHSYMEYLRAVHKEVMDKMASDSAQSDLATWEMLNHGY